MSVLGKKWFIKNAEKNKETIQKILENRGMENFEEMSDFHDPFLFKDMEKSVERINRAIESQERIIIFGDYDVDGITGTAILVRTLSKMKANISCRLPNRVEDGYGLSEKFIKEFMEKNVKLVITVDCGISCKNEIKMAADNGIDTIITDHHTIPKSLPEAFAILHPKQADSNYPFDGLTGAGVALKLAHALIQRNLPKSEREEWLNPLLDLASLGTVADIGSLTDENRLIVKKGLDVLSNTRWAGLKRIKELANLQEGTALDTTKIGFQIAPRINAAGRIGDPYIALKLLIKEEHDEKIDKLGMELEELNNKRREMTEYAMEEAEKGFLENRESKYIIIDEDPEWHVGILGLIAGKLVEKHGRPSIMMRDLGGTLVASARSPEYFNIIEAITDSSDYLIGFGGHARAAGFSLKKENLAGFKEKISQYAAEKLNKIDIKATLEIDCELNGEEINFDLITQIEKLRPFGMDNNKPTFVMKDIEPFFINLVGQKGDHLKFNVKIANRDFRVIAFRMGQFVNELKQQQKIDLVFHLDRNNWRDRDYIQLQALDFSFNE